MYRNDLSVLAKLEAGEVGVIRFKELKVFRPLQAALGCLGVTISGDEKAGEVYQTKVSGKLGFSGPFVGARDGVAILALGEVEIPLAGLIGTGIERSSERVTLLVDSQLKPDPDRGALVLDVMFTVKNEKREVDIAEEVYCSLPALAEGETRTLPKIRDMVKAITEGSATFLSWPSSGGVKLVDVPPGEYYLSELGERTPSKLYPGKFDQRATLAAKIGGGTYPVFLPDRTQKFLQGYDAILGESIVTVGEPLVYTDKEGKERKQANLTLKVDTFKMKEDDLGDW